MADRTITHFKIFEKLGGGGMGVVYKAEDTKLKRPVALKFLQPELSRDDEAEERFILEAQAASALDHPNICTIYEIGETDDEQIFIAMAYYEGETLAAKIKQQKENSKVSLDWAVDIAMQIVQGLGKAHEKGIVHRDIKPANLMITKDGVIKILDFGLAKLAGGTRLTRTGTTLGTPAYMSPEQVSLLETDQRTDIWSLGVVMYEMLTGQLPFKGEHHHAVMYSIVNMEPEPITSLRADVSFELEKIVNQCLVKEPAERYQAVSEVQADLGKLRLQAYLGTTTVKQKPVSSASLAMKRKNRLIGLTFVAAILLLATIGYYFFRPAAPPARPMNTIRLTSYPGLESHPTFSPDGNQVAFAWNGAEGKNQDIYIKQIGVGTYEPFRLTDHPASDFSPSWSPDGRYIAFMRRDGDEVSIYQKPVLGGAERKLASVQLQAVTNPLRSASLSWSPDGKLLAFVDQDSSQENSTVFLLSLATLERRQLLQPYSGIDGSILEARISPDGSTLAFTRGTRSSANSGIQENESTDIYVLPLAGGEPKQLTFDHVNTGGLAWSRDSREIVYTSNRIRPGEEMSFNHARLWRISATGGEPELLPLNVDWESFPTISADGRRLAYAELKPERWSVWRYETPASSGQPIAPAEVVYSTEGEVGAEYSPDGTKMVFASHRSGSDEIWVCDSDGRIPVQLTFLRGPRTGTPRWSPDGRFIAFDSWRDGHADVYTISAEGGEVRKLTTGPQPSATPSWSRDGRWIYFNFHRTREPEVWKIPAEGGSKVQVTFNGGGLAQESPDGKWVYFQKRSQGTENNWSESIWRIPVSGGEEALVVGGFNVGTFTVFEDGIYFMHLNAHWEEQGQASLMFYNFESEQAETLIDFQELVLCWPMSVSPDRRYALGSRQVEDVRQDIMLVENFR